MRRRLLGRPYLNNFKRLRKLIGQRLARRAEAARLTPPPPGSLKIVPAAVVWISEDGTMHTFDYKATLPEHLIPPWHRWRTQPLIPSGRPAGQIFCLICREELSVHGCRVQWVDEARILVTCRRPPTAPGAPPIPGAAAAPPPEGQPT